MTKTARKLFLPAAAIVTSVFGAFVPIANVSAADAVVTNYDELVAALSDSSSKIVVDGDITLEDDVTINKVMRMNSATTLDTNGHTMTLNKTMAVWADTTIIGNGGIESDIENPIMAIEGNLTIEDGNYSAETANDLLPYGNYELREIAANSAYILNTQIVEPFTVAKNKEVSRRYDSVIQVIYPEM